MADNSNEKIDIERVWKDEEYRNSLTPEQLATIPPNPAGEELDNTELDDISGGLKLVSASIGCNVIGGADGAGSKRQV